MNTRIPSLLFLIGWALLIAAIGLFLQSNHLAKSDALAYWCGTKLFWEGRNVYSLSEQALCQTGDAGRRDVLMVWNPPLFFVTFGFLYSASRSVMAYIVVLAAALACAGMLWFGFSLSKCTERRRREILPAGILGLVPFFFEARLGQFSSLICGALCGGYGSMLRRMDFASGLFFALCVIKPHTVLIPCCLLGVQILWQRRWMIIAGAVLGLVGLSVLAEGLHPGIHQAWIQRETWPTPYLGSTLVSLLRSGAILHLHKDPRFIIWLFPLVAVLGFCAFQFSGTGKLEFTSKQICLACLLNPFFSPYGFAFDQVLLALPVGYLLGTTSKYTNLPRSFLFPLLFWGALFISDKVHIFGLDAWWFSFPLIVGAVWCFVLSAEGTE